MCGIVGYFGRPDASVAPRALLSRMIDAIVHRGPDQQGIFTSDGIGLGHADTKRKQFQRNFGYQFRIGAGIACHFERKMRRGEMMENDSDAS